MTILNVKHINKRFELNHHNHHRVCQDHDHHRVCQHHDYHRVCLNQFELDHYNQHHIMINKKINGIKTKTSHHDQGVPRQCAGDGEHQEVPMQEARQGIVINILSRFEPFCV